MISNRKIAFPMVLSILTGHIHFKFSAGSNNRNVPSSIGMSRHGSSTNVEATGIPHSSSNNNNISSSSKATVNVILNNVAPPVPTVVTAAGSSATGFKQQGISSTVTVNSMASGK